MAEMIPGSLHEALLALQADLPTVDKTQEADAGKYKYKYAGLNEVSDAILPRLNALGLTWITTPTMAGDRFVLVYTLHHKAGEEITGQYLLPDRGSSQEIGAAITYARRYALCAVTGVAPGGDDNDAKQASKTKTAVPDATITEWVDVLNAANTVVEIEIAWKQIAHLGLSKEAALIRAGADRKKQILTEAKA